MLRKSLFLFLWLATLSARAQEKADYIGLYSELLAYHAKQPQRLAALKLPAYPPVPREVLERLNPDVLKAHILKYVNEYVGYKKRLAKSETDLVRMRKQIRDLPLTNLDQRPNLELAIAAQNKLIQDIPAAIFGMSMNANLDLAQSLKTLPPEKRVAGKTEDRPKMPGVFEGSFEDRMKKRDDEKIFLTPVDNEFYDTQLGRKIERDFGGKAEYWSYDYDEDLLYVRVKGDVGRVMVMKDQGGVRWIKARSGADFKEIPRSGDEKVDLLKAKGRFLTGDKNEEALFGDMPKKNGPPVVDESRPHAASKEHDHDH
jgi:hypothetical protein